jgi:curved DNA-binding protein CbpA
MDSLPDAYAVLQIHPEAEPPVLDAAFRALARQYHPDGSTPDSARMARINRAYALLRTPELRARYDQYWAARRSRPVGPGHIPPARAASHSVSAHLGRDTGPSLRRTPDAGGPSTVLDFGRYAGWSIVDLARHDPDYLRWLCRHSSGLRFRSEIQRHLGYEPDMERRANSIS